MFVTKNHCETKKEIVCILLFNGFQTFINVKLYNFTNCLPLLVYCKTFTLNI